MGTEGVGIEEYGSKKDSDPALKGRAIGRKPLRGWGIGFSGEGKSVFQKGGVAIKLRRIGAVIGNGIAASGLTFSCRQMSCSPSRFSSDKYSAGFSNSPCISHPTSSPNFSIVHPRR